MKQGKFEAPRRKKEKPQKAPAAQAHAATPPAAVAIPPRDPAAPRGAVPEPAPAAEEPRRRRDWLLFAVPAAVLLALAVILTVSLLRDRQTDPDAPAGMTKEETLAHYRQLAQTLEHGELVFTLIPDDPAGGEPFVLKLSPAESRIRVDLAGLETDIKNGVGKVRRGRYLPDPASYVSLDRAALRSLAKQAAETVNQPFLDSFASLETVGPPAADGTQAQQVLVLSKGQRGRSVSEEAVYLRLLAAYFDGDLEPTMEYRTKIPEALDRDEIWDRFCVAPVDAVMDEKTFVITPEVPGYGFTRERLDEALDRLDEGRSLTLSLGTLAPAVTAQQLEDALFADVLAEAHTPHSWVDDRTVNLMLACDEINGKILMPGELFSFNETVGERTAAKGYREATAYIGGASVPEIGGGVCQVASSIYYAVLQADLYTVERHAHTYLVTYVPHGMDAAIYWGALDYKFENSSPYPIKIEASVSDGEVHIILLGTEWKDYTLKLSYKINQEVPYETKERVVTDGSYKNGETIVSPYTGYTITTYKTLSDLQGNVIDTVKIKTSMYNKRDKVVAVVPQPTEPPSSSDAP